MTDKTNADPQTTDKTTKDSSDYGADKIQHLEGIEGIRHRPQMYIGSTDQVGLHHLLFEVTDNVLDEFVKNRYRSFDSGIGQKIESGKATFADCEKYILDKGEAAPNESGRQEYLENLINQYI